MFAKYILTLMAYCIIHSFTPVNVVAIRRKIYDEYNDEEVELTKEEIKHIRRLLKGKAPHAEFDPYAVCYSCSYALMIFGLRYCLGFILKVNS